MLKTPIRPGIVVAGLAGGPGLRPCGGCPAWQRTRAHLFVPRRSKVSSTTPEPLPPLTTVTIQEGQGLFEPFILAVQPNTTMTWQNHDTVAHTIMTTPDQTPFLN